MRCGHRLLLPTMNPRYSGSIQFYLQILLNSIHKSSVYELLMTSGVDMSFLFVQIFTFYDQGKQAFEDRERLPR